MSWKIKFHILLTGTSLALLMYFDQRGEALEPKVRIAQSESGSNKAAVPAAQVKPSEPHFLGVASCSAVACHGGDGPSDQRNYEPGSEYSTWVQNDPHAQAFSVLKNDVSIKMAKALNLEKPAHESPLCLNCHGPQEASPTNDARMVNHQLIEGVSCEACHGNAEKWLIVHRRTDWKAGKSPDQIWQEYGFRDTKDPWTRAQVCASCHVGAAGGKDVNHDLYAAGHPRLFFELAAFNANLPAHWNRNEDRAAASSDAGRTSTFEAKLWSVGQVAGVHAAVDLAVDRAKRSQAGFTFDEKYPAGATVPAWPEFAETGCFACHHNLQAPSWQQSRGFSNRAAGGLPWQSWLVPLATDAAGFSTPDGTPQLKNELAEFSRLMSTSRPRQALVIERGEALKAGLAELGMQISDANRQVTREQIVGTLSRLVSQPVRERLVGENWDSATQLYLAVVALSEATRDADGQFGQPPSSDMTAALETMRSQLEFLNNWDSPKSYSTIDVREDSPHRLILKQLEAISAQVK